MALRRKGKYFFGEAQADIREELLRYGRLNGYVPDGYADARCLCGASQFGLMLDEDEGVAVRTCVACGREHVMADGAEYLEDAEPQECACPCGAGAFELTVAVSRYPDSDAVRWLYVGARCVTCGLTATYGDWKNEFEDAPQLLRQV